MRREPDGIQTVRAGVPLGDPGTDAPAVLVTVALGDGDACRASVLTSMKVARA